MKVLICSVYSAGGEDPFLSLLPVGVGSLVAVLRKAGMVAKAANLNGLPFEEIRKILSVEQPNLLGVSVMTHNRHDSVQLAELAKELNPACFVVFGGPHATHRCRELLEAYPAVDAVVLGEGEDTLRELTELLTATSPGTSLTSPHILDGLKEVRGLAFRGTQDITVTPPRPPLPDLDILPPAYTGFEKGVNIDLRHQLEFLITSRGCPATCTFCNSPLFWGRNLRFRSPRSIVDEISAIRDLYGLIYFSIRDDTFTSDRERVIEFCRLLRKERLFILWNCQSRVSAVDDKMLLRMRQAGCDCIQYGIESGSPAILQRLGKRITRAQIIRAARATRRAGIRLSLYLITGIPEETEQELAETLNLLEAVKADDGQVSPLAYYPGNRLFDETVTTGAVPADIFENSPEEALYVRTDPCVANYTRRLLRKIESVAASVAPNRRVLEEQQCLTGYCHAGNITRGEFLADQGDIVGAEEAFREITDREPDNPWGWLMLGELWRDAQQTARAVTAFQKLAELVPTHLPAWEAMADLYRLAGNRDGVRRCRAQAKKLTAVTRRLHQGESHVQSTQ